jgi:hypothetical protein
MISEICPESAVLTLWWACSQPGTSESPDTTGASPEESSEPSVPDPGDPADEQVRPADLLTPNDVPGLVLELHAVEGKAPAAEVLELVQQELDLLVASGHITKDWIELRAADTLSPLGAGPHSFETLSELLYAHAGPSRTEDAAVIAALYADGSYEDDDGDARVLGFAWGGRYLVMLPDNIELACESSPGLSLLLPGMVEEACHTSEATVMLHELGHLFGLVNNGLPMVQDHEDTEHPAHDHDDACLMFWAAETSRVVDEIGERFGRGDATPKRLDEACLADMAALQAL